MLKTLPSNSDYFVPLVALMCDSYISKLCITFKDVIYILQCSCLFFFQLTDQKDFIIHLARTPNPVEDEGKNQELLFYATLLQININI